MFFLKLNEIFLNVIVEILNFKIKFYKVFIYFICRVNFFYLDIKIVKVLFYYKIILYVIGEFCIRV